MSPRLERKIDKSLLLSAIGVVLTFGVAWGRLTYQNEDHDKRIAALEKQAERMGRTEAQMKFFLFYKGLPK